jgi:hypothetical protein
MGPQLKTKVIVLGSWDIQFCTNMRGKFIRALLTKNEEIARKSQEVNIISLTSRVIMWTQKNKVNIKNMNLPSFTPYWL